MGAMNDFFGKPLFQPTGTDWIDHAFTAAVLDDIEQEERRQRASAFAAFTSDVKTPIKSDPSDTEGHISSFDFGGGPIPFRDFVEHYQEMVKSLLEYEGFIFAVPSNGIGCGITPLVDGSPTETLFIYVGDEDPSDIPRFLIEGLLCKKDREIKIKYYGAEPDEDGEYDDIYFVTIDG